MNKRLLSKLEQGEGTTLMGKLFLTPRQRQTVLKWFLFSLVYLALQVLQDVVFSRVQVLGGCPDLVPGYLLLVCLTQGPGSGGCLLSWLGCSGAYPGRCWGRCPCWWSPAPGCCCPPSGEGICSGGFGL